MQGRRPLVSRMEDVHKLKEKNIVHRYGNDTIFFFFVPFLYLFFLPSLSSTAVDAANGWLEVPTDGSRVSFH